MIIIVLIISEDKNIITNNKNNNNIFMTCNTKNIYQRKEKLLIHSKNNAWTTQPECMIPLIASLSKPSQTFCTHTLSSQHEGSSLNSQRKEAEIHPLKPIILYDRLNTHTHTKKKRGAL